MGSNLSSGRRSLSVSSLVNRRPSPVARFHITEGSNGQNTGLAIVPSIAPLV